MEIPAKSLHPGPGFHPRVPRCGTDFHVAAAAVRLRGVDDGVDAAASPLAVAPSGTYVFAGWSSPFHGVHIWRSSHLCWSQSVLHKPEEAERESIARTFLK
ncbi:hypothetical protein C2845_PM02G33640 [Panicum miliaceum]|uniref:Uncharacterized protein n=1 Tax=Panicum miliaceum TaxID=4540 RepID=A0A3L6SH02_PANMI|nr:hypothetical protein C2845_PM02G33640 [Panicum miliaceum]